MLMFTTDKVWEVWMMEDMDDDRASRMFDCRDVAGTSRKNKSEPQSQIILVFRIHRKIENIVFNEWIRWKWVLNMNDMRNIR